MKKINYDNKFIRIMRINNIHVYLEIEFDSLKFFKKDTII